MNAETDHQLREAFLWGLGVASDHNFWIVLLLGALCVAVVYILHLTRSASGLQAARLRAYAEAHEWSKGHTLVVHNLAWRLLMELIRYRSTRSRDHEPSQAAVKRAARITRLEEEAMRVLYARPVLPVVKPRHESQDDEEVKLARPELPADG